MKVSKAALIAALMTGGSFMLASAPASAQEQEPRERVAQQRAGQARPAQPRQQQAQRPQRQYDLTRAERTAIGPLALALTAAATARTSGQTANWAAVQAALPAAQAAARGPDARYLVALAQREIGRGTSNAALERQGLDALIATSGTPAVELEEALNKRAEIAADAQDFDMAERLFSRLAQMRPDDQRISNNLRIVQQRRGNGAGALQTVLQSIRTREATDGRAPQEMYLNALRIVYAARDRAQSIDFARRLARNYPTPANWRDAVRVYREFAPANDASLLDTLRLMRASGGLEGENEYRTFVTILDQAALPGEAKAVIDEGIRSGALRANDPDLARRLATANRRIGEDRTGLDAQIRAARTAPNGRAARAVADALYGYGRYAEAAELYRVAAGKPGEDRNMLNLRLGAALAMAGQRAEAETVFGAVTGDTADLAKFWLAWLGRHTG